MSSTPTATATYARRRGPDRAAKQPNAALTLRKGSTFHSPKSPSSPVDDPVLSVSSLPDRSPSSPQALQDLIAAAEKRALDLIDECLSHDEKAVAAATAHHKAILPVPRFMLANIPAALDSLGIDDKIKSEEDLSDNKHKSATTSRSRRHTSDSGLGSSVHSSPSSVGSHNRHLRLQPTGLATAPSLVLSAASVYSTPSSYHTAAVTQSMAAVPKTRFLSEHATNQIKKYIVEPILRLQTLKEFHPIVQDLPNRISDRHITCLRDLEKTLIFLAPASSRSAASYLSFCETSIQCIHTTVDHLNAIDQCRPTDRPYTNRYFVDLVEQVRQYARIMAATRLKQANGEELSPADYSPNEKITLQVTKDGPAELVREKDGQTIPITGDAVLKRTSSNMDTVDDEGVAWSMARKRKCDIGKEEIHPCRQCGKEFKRPCDLTKHAKTHSRPWKCPEAGCKYYDLGWPTEKERDRHVNDKHSADPPTFHCHFENCPYTSKRESNCKQHMEKAHGWEYVRSKSKNVQKLPGQALSPPTPLTPTPSSGMAYLSPTSTPAAPTPSDFTAPISRSTSVGAAGPSNYQHMDPLSIDSNLFDMSGTYNTTPLDYSASDANGFNFADLSMPMPVHTPALSDGHRDSFGSPSTGVTQPSPEMPVAPNSFEENFAGHDMVFDNTANLFPPLADFFPQYYMEQPGQNIPDFMNFPKETMDMDSSAYIATKPTTRQIDGFALQTPADDLSSAAFDTSFPAPATDFTLFGEIGTLPPSVNSLFPELADHYSPASDDMSMEDLNDDTMFAA